VTASRDGLQVGRGDADRVEPGSVVQSRGSRQPTVLSAVLNLNLALAFFLELAVLAFVGMWAFGLTDQPFVRVLTVAGALAVFIAGWALFGAPRATVRLPGPAKVSFFLLWFGLGALALAGAGHPIGAVLFFLGYLLNLALVSLRPRS